ncbi:vegetative cell wall protein gp1-like [Phocoena sinus]|uniref:vegetative cell wall protein gp1-like n=1 Tax=Phocoena sinus TaxID=42100 RepID=UPI0013C4651B|nr:vegetative cell wall protein gp1-like [Phocoena sinus]
MAAERGRGRADSGASAWLRAHPLRRPGPAGWQRCKKATASSPRRSRNSDPCERLGRPTQPAALRASSPPASSLSIPFAVLCLWGPSSVTPECPLLPSDPHLAPVSAPPRPAQSQGIDSARPGPRPTPAPSFARLPLAAPSPPPVPLGSLGLQRSPSPPPKPAVPSPPFPSPPLLLSDFSCSLAFSRRPLRTPEEARSKEV